MINLINFFYLYFCILEFYLNRLPCIYCLCMKFNDCIIRTSIYMCRSA